MLDENKKDLCIISKEEVKEQIENAEKFIDSVEQYVKRIIE